MNKKLKTATEFLEMVVKILGENELYKSIYGELPTDKDSMARIARANYIAAQPLMKSLDVYFEKLSQPSNKGKEQ